MTLPILRARRLSFRSLGPPIGQAALNHSGKRSYWANAKVLLPWREQLATDALVALDGQPLFAGGVALYCAFAVRRPQRPKFTLPITRGLDVDHGVRACGDALTGVCFADDAQIVDMHASKRYAGDHGELAVPGVRITVIEVLA